MDEAGILPGQHNRHLKTQPGGVIPARRNTKKTMEDRETKDGTYNRHEVIITAQNSEGEYVANVSRTAKTKLPENGELYHYHVAIQSWRNEKPPCGRSQDCHFDVHDAHTTFSLEEAQKVAKELETKWNGPRLADLDDDQGELAMHSPADFIGFATYTITMILQGTPCDTGYPQIIKRLADCGWGSEPELFQFVGIAGAVAHRALKVREDYEDTIERGIYLDIVYGYAERFCAWLEEWTGNELDPWDAREIEIRNLMHETVDAERKHDDTQFNYDTKEATA